MLRSMNDHSMCYRHSCNKAGLWSDSKCSTACFPGGWSSFVSQTPIFPWVFRSSTIKHLHPLLDTTCQTFRKVLAYTRSRGPAAWKSWLLNSAFSAHAAQNAVRWSPVKLQWIRLPWVVQVKPWELYHIQHAKENMAEHEPETGRVRAERMSHTQPTKSHLRFKQLSLESVTSASQ